MKIIKETNQLCIYLVCCKLDTGVVWFMCIPAEGQPISLGPGFMALAYQPEETGFSVGIYCTSEMPVLMKYFCDLAIGVGLKSISCCVERYNWRNWSVPWFHSLVQPNMAFRLIVNYSSKHLHSHSTLHVLGS